MQTPSSRLNYFFDRVYRTTHWAIIADPFRSKESNYGLSSYPGEVRYPGLSQTRTRAQSSTTTAGRRVAGLGQPRWSPTTTRSRSITDGSVLPSARSP